jgi:hypothetical protein
MRRNLLAAAYVLAIVVAALAVAVPGAKGAVIFFKGGTFIRAKEPLRIEGRSAIITLVTGTVASYPLDQVDLVQTERYNKLGLGDSIVVMDDLLHPVPTATPTPSLGGLATIDLRSNPLLGTSVPPTPTPTPGIQLQNQPYHDARVDGAFTQMFDDLKLYSYRTSAGTQPEYFFVQASTDNQQQVFQALKVVTQTYATIHELNRDLAPLAVELQMISVSGKPAGTFRITPEMAHALAGGEVSVEQFYVNYVIF